jgi:hypothetical protein
VLTSVAVHDPGAGAVTCPRPAAPGLEPQATITCTADARVTVGRAEIAAGKVVDTATATGADAQGRSSPPSEPATLKIPTTRVDPRVTLTKRATVSPAGAQARLGGTISYSYTVTNVGQDALTAVWVDPRRSARWSVPHLRHRASLPASHSCALPVAPTW